VYGYAAMCPRVLEALFLGHQVAGGCEKRKVQFEHVGKGTSGYRKCGRVRKAVVGKHTANGSGTFW
jgi:hypothetical protein